MQAGVDPLFDINTRKCRIFNRWISGERYQIQKSNLLGLVCFDTLVWPFVLKRPVRQGNPLFVTADFGLKLEAPYATKLMFTPNFMSLIKLILAGKLFCFISFKIDYDFYRTPSSRCLLYYNFWSIFFCAHLPLGATRPVRMLP